ncbi:MAG: molybdopterin-binding protein [Bacillota bacterium]|nr:molybdopterin-binding protein [Bacillota bacterium]
MEFFTVVTPDEAKKLVSEKWKLFPRIVKQPVLASLGRILAEEVIALEDVPGFAKSTVDGYAVKAANTFGASESLPAYLELAGRIEMGTSSKCYTLEEDQLIKVPTGGMLPAGADAVVMIEQTEEVSQQLVAVLKSVAPGENVILSGEDVSKGARILPAGRQLKAVDIGALAAVGKTEVNVWEPVKVGIISTGDEIVSPDEQLFLGQVRDINSFTLAGFVQEAGGIANLYGIVPDEYELLKNTIVKALAENDLVLVSGGSSVGVRDYTSGILEELGDPGIIFHGVSIKPGKPTLAAVANGKLIFGLPGHPASAITAYHLLVDQLIRYGSYQEDPILEEKKKIKAKLAKGVASTAGRKDYIPVTLVEADGAWVATPLLGKSGLILPIVKSDGYLVIPLHCGGLEPGQEVVVTIW